jgi:hypothetical protein
MLENAPIRCTGPSKEGGIPKVLDHLLEGADVGVERALFRMTAWYGCQGVLQIVEAPQHRFPVSRNVSPHAQT